MRERKRERERETMCVNMYTTQTAEIPQYGDISDAVTTAGVDNIAVLSISH